MNRFHHTKNQAILFWDPEPTRPLLQRRALNCQARFTQAGSLQRHTQKCSQGKTLIMCPGERVEAPKSSFEKVFFPQHSASQESIKWLEQEAKQ